MPSTILARVALAFACTLACAGAAAGNLAGAGATFPAPVYDRWAAAYASQCSCSVRYDAVGSGAGIDRVKAGSVDFGGSDAPLAPAELAQAHLLQIPTVIGAVVAVVNIAGLAPGQLVLDAHTLSAIYRGEIRRWNDPAIAALNAGLELPDANITVVHRSDASGTTYLWSQWLSGGDDAWRRGLGSAIMLAWPVGVGGEGNEGVASLVQRTRWSIGYVQFAYARAHHLSDVALPNHDGQVVRASRESFEAAVAAARWQEPADLARNLSDAPGARSWPIIGASYVLVPESRKAQVLPFFDWALASGAQAARELGYVPLPPAAVHLVDAVSR